MKKNEYLWKTVTFVDEESLPAMLQSIEVNGWEVFTIDLSEYTIIARKLKVERLDD